MANRKYWEIFVDEALPEMGLTVPDVLHDELLDAIICHAEMESEATGESVASANRYATLQREITDARKETEYEREKVTCGSCRGTGGFIKSGGRLLGNECWECRGEGRVHPRKASRETIKQFTGY